MNDSVWMLNPGGMEVEVEAIRKDTLLKQGFKLLENYQVKSIESKPKLNLAIPGQAQYPYGGYGRVVELLELMFEFTPDSPNKLYIGYPRPIEKKEGDRLFLISAFEADKLPADFLEWSKYFEVIILPSEWCKKIFQENGVTTPIEVMIQGTDNFEIIQHTSITPFKFLHYNAFSDYKRKGWDLVVKAFIDIFGRDENVELILKGRKHDNDADIKEVPIRSNIKIIIENMKRGELNHLQEQAHCFVYPSRGEGIGLPPIELMARGIPTIVTNWSGMTEFAEMAIPINSFARVEAHYDLPFNGMPSHWIEPNVHVLKDTMWDVYRNYDRYKRQAVIMAGQVKQKFSINAQKERFISIINKYVQE